MLYVICYTENGDKKWKTVGTEEELKDFLKSALNDKNSMVFDINNEIDQILTS
jgi:hypothetical protein